MMMVEEGGGKGDEGSEEVDDVRGRMEKREAVTKVEQ